MTCTGARINAIMDYASKRPNSDDIIGGFQNFEEGVEGNVPIYMAHFILSGAAEYRGDIPGNEIGNPDPRNVPDMFRAANRYALNHGYAAGIPNLHKHGEANVYGIILFKPGTVEIQDVKASDLIDLIPGDDGSRFREVFRYMDENNMPFGAAFPNFEQQMQEGNLVYGVVFVKNEAIRSEMVKYSDLDMPRYDAHFCPDITDTGKQEHKFIIKLNQIPIEWLITADVEVWTDEIIVKTYFAGIPGGTDEVEKKGESQVVIKHEHNPAGVASIEKWKIVFTRFDETRTVEVRGEAKVGGKIVAKFGYKKIYSW